MTTSPESSADTGAGAPPCAGGSQKWNGNSAVFTASPASIAPPAIHTSMGGSPAASSGVSVATDTVP